MKTKSRPSVFFALIAVFGLLILAQSCAKSVKSPALALKGEAGKAAELALHIEGFEARTKFIKALAKFEISNGEELRRTEAAIVVGRPDKIRIDAMDALADVWASSGAVGEDAWIYLPAKKKLYSGSPLRKRMDKYLETDIALKDVISLITGVPPFGNATDLVSVGRPKDKHFAAGPLHIWTKKAAAEVVKCVRYGSSESEIEYLVTFDDYRVVDGVRFPYRVEVLFPKKGARALMEFTDVSIAKEVSPDVFLAPRPERKTKSKAER